MTTTLAVTEAIASINEAQSRFNLSRTTDLQFFSEWQETLPELTQVERETLDRVKNSYLYNSADGAMTEAKEPAAQYDLSTDFSIFARPQNELYEVLRVMKRIDALIAPTSNP